MNKKSTKTSLYVTDSAELNRSIGKRIKILRRTIPVTQEELSEQANLSQNFISQLENGQKSPSIETLLKIAHVLEIPFHELFIENSSVSPDSNNGKDGLDKKIIFAVKSLNSGEKNMILDIMNSIKKNRNKPLKPN